MQFQEHPQEDCFMLPKEKMPRYPAPDTPEPPDPVHLPQHYARYKIEPIYFIMENGFDFETGNVIKYVARAPHKNGVEDLKKARRYLDMMIRKAEGDTEYAR